MEHLRKSVEIIIPSLHLESEGRHDLAKRKVFPRGRGPRVRTATADVDVKRASMNRMVLLGKGAKDQSLLQDNSRKAETKDAGSEKCRRKIF